MKEFILVFQTHSVPENGDLWFSLEPMAYPTYTVSGFIFFISSLTFAQAVRSILGNELCTYLEQADVKCHAVFLTCGACAHHLESLSELHRLM